MDSAADVYAFALKTKGVDIAGVPAEAYPALVKMALSTQTSAPARLAADSASLTRAGEFAKQFGGKLPAKL